MPNKYGFRMTKEVRKKAIVLYKGGLSQQAVADIVKVDRSAISYWTRRLGISRNLSEAHIGQHSSPATQFKKGHKTWNKGLKGYMAKEKNSNWQGGITALHYLIRHCDLYNEWRNKIYKQDSYTCECSYHGSKIIAHHIDKTFTEIFNEFLQEYNQFSPYEDKETLLRLSFTYKPFWKAKGKVKCKRCHTIIHIGVTNGRLY